MSWHHNWRQSARLLLPDCIAAAASPGQPGSPEIALRGAESFGYRPAEGETEPTARAARQRSSSPRSVAGLAIQPQSAGLRDRIWWGSGTRATAAWAARLGLNLQSSTLLTEDTGVPFDELQAEQIRLYREA